MTPVTLERTAGALATVPAPILFLHEGEDWLRGSERCLLDLLAALDRGRYTPRLLCTAPRLAAAAEALDVATRLVPGWRVAGERLLPVRDDVRRLDAEVAAHGVRLIHANSTLPVKTALVVARHRRLPLVAHLHLPETAESRLYGGLHQVDRLIGVSQSSLDGFAGDGTPPARLRLVYNGVDPVRLSAGDARSIRAELGIPADALVAVAVCSLIHRKGVDVLIHAMARLAAHRPVIHLVIAGDGPEREALERLAATEGVTDRIHLLGNRDDVGAVLRDAADMVVSASRAETFGLNLIEGAYHGLPAVATDIPAHHEAAPAGLAALLVPVDDPAAFAGAVARLAADGDLRETIGARARARVHEGFLLEHHVARIQTLYGELLDAPAASYGWRRGTAWPAAYWRWLARATARRLPLGLPLRRRRTHAD